MLMANQVDTHEAHPDAFHVSGPPNLTTFNWRDLISSSWKDANYKRTVIACLIQAVYLLELDRQEKRTQENGLAPNWWIPFKYKLTKTLIDERDGSIFGAIFEWDRSAAWDDLVPIRPRGAPRAVLALRGSLLESPTRRRDVEDDIRFLAWESLKGSVRFKVALEVLKSVSDTYGSSNVCIVGHSLGAGFAFQVGRVLAKEGIYVETHLFNPPSFSLAMSLGNIAEKAQYVWNRLKSVLPSSSKAQVSNDGDETSGVRLKSWMHQLSGLKDAGFGVSKWVPHLYVNNNDYICCYYIDPVGTGEKDADKENLDPTNEQIAAKLFVVSKEKQKFLEAHSLKQWWSGDAELQQAIHNSKLISRQLRSLYTDTPLQETNLYNPPSISLVISLGNIGEMAELVWNRLISVLPSRSQAQVSNDVGMTSVVHLKSWIPLLSGLKHAAFGVSKWIHHLYVNKSDNVCFSYTDPSGTGEKIADKKKMSPTNGQIAANLFAVSKGKQKFLLAHGLEQWWSSDKELQRAIHSSKLINRQLRSLSTDTPPVTHLLNPPTFSLAMSLSNIGEREDFVWKWNIIKSMLPSNCKAQGSNDGDKTSGVRLKGWIPQLSGLKDPGLGRGKWVPHLYINTGDHISWLLRSLYTGTPSQVTDLLSGLKDAGFGVGKWIPHLYINASDYITRQLRSLYTGTPSQVTDLFYLPSFSLAMSLRYTEEKAEFVWNRLKSMRPPSSGAQVSNDGDKTSGVQLKNWIPQLSGLKEAGFWVGKWVPHLYVNKSEYVYSSYTEPGCTREIVDKENLGPTNGQNAENLFLVSKEKQKFLEAHGLEQWWSSDTELQQAINNSKLISKQLRFLYTATPWQVTHLLNLPSVSLAMSFRKAHWLEHRWSSEAELRQAMHNSQLISRQLRSLYTVTPSQVTQGKPSTDGARVEDKENKTSF